MSGRTLGLGSAAAIMAGVASLALSSTGEASPPPPPSDVVQTFEAINSLDSFLGAWEGDEIHHLSEKDIAFHVYRQVIRPPLSDYLLMVEYRDKSFSSLSVLVYSPADSAYRLVLLGYRLGAVNSTGADTIPVARPDERTLKWEVDAILPGDVSVVRRTTVTLKDGQWSETREVLFPDGKWNSSSKALLRRTAVQRWNIPDIRPPRP